MKQLIVLALMFLSDVPEPFDAAPLMNHTIPEGQNAFTEYVPATQKFENADAEVSQRLDRVLGEGWVYVDEDVVRFLDKNNAAFQLWKLGTQKEKALHQPLQTYDVTKSLDIPISLRNLHTAVLVKCRAFQAEGRLREAGEWYQALIRASRHLGQYGSFLERLAGSSCFERTATGIEHWSTHPTLTAGDLHTMLRQLQNNWQLTEKTSTVWKIEYLMLLKNLERIEKGELKENFSERLDPKPELKDESVDLTAEYELTRRLLKIYQSYHLNYCDLPRFKRPPLNETSGVFENDDGISIPQYEGTAEDYKRLLHQSLRMKDYAKSILPLYRALDREETRYRCLLVVLAGQAFYRDHDRFPRKLDELVPEYFEEIPVDNYDGKPLKYRYTEIGPVVYSVFENGIDDGGFEWIYGQKQRGQEHPADFGMQLKLFQPEPLRASKP